jgi:hypothetical protein
MHFLRKEKFAYSTPICYVNLRQLKFNDIDFKGLNTVLGMGPPVNSVIYNDLFIGLVHK